MKNWRLLILIGLFTATSAPTVFAYLWESQAAIEQRYGQPVKTIGYPDDRAYTYAFENFQVEIEFFNSSSQKETYSLMAPNRQLDAAEIRRILEANSAGQGWAGGEKVNEWVVDGPSGRAYAAYFPDLKPPQLHLYTDDSVKRMIDPTSWSRPPRTSKEETFTAVLTVRREEKVTRLILRSEKLVIDIPWSAEGYPERGHVISGKTYSVTLRDEADFDTGSALAFVSDREHKKFEELIADSKTYLLVRIQDGGEVVYDRAVCEVHHVKMAEKIARVVYGMWAASSDEEVTCTRFFPHYRDFILGGCLVSDSSPKTGLLYICPKCVEECARLKF
jgi:hypothetical protein